jgi:hypothetical protein
MRIEKKGRPVYDANINFEQNQILISNLSQCRWTVTVFQSIQKL